MNEADTQIVTSVLAGAGLSPTDSPETADVMLINTCAVREPAEAKVSSRLNQLRAMRTKKGKRNTLVGVLGCMAERLKNELLEHENLVNFIAGPDAYRGKCPDCFELARMLNFQTLIAFFRTQICAFAKCSVSIFPRESSGSFLARVLGLYSLFFFQLTLTSVQSSCLVLPQTCQGLCKLHGADSKP
jgi:hypothetical protein